MDLIYSISVMEILHPRINDTVRDGGKYNQTPEDHIFLRYAASSFQTLYAYWDRVGDFLDLYFDTKQKGDVYLSRVFKQFPVDMQSKKFFELKELYEDKVMPVIEGRHDVVHSFTLKNKHYWGVIEHGSGNMEEVEKLQKEKDSYPTLFRTQLEHMFNGFDLMLQLIAELPKKE